MRLRTALDCPAQIVKGVGQHGHVVDAGGQKVRTSGGNGAGATDRVLVLEAPWQPVKNVATGVSRL